MLKVLPSSSRGMGTATLLLVNVSAPGNHRYASISSGNMGVVLISNIFELGAGVASEWPVDVNDLTVGQWKVKRARVSIELDYIVYHKMFSSGIVIPYR